MKCSRCSKEATPGKKMCEGCRTKMNSYLRKDYNKRKSCELCVVAGCKNPLSSNSTIKCTYHLEKAKICTTKYDAKRRGKVLSPINRRDPLQNYNTEL